MFALMLVMPLTVQAKKVESEKAQKVAQRFAESKRGPQAQKGVRLKHIGKRQRQGQGGRPGRPGTGPQGGQEDTLYYVFNIDADSSSEGGFIIVAGDDVAKPVLGYSDEGGYDENNLPPEFVYWMDFLQDEIAYAQEQNIPQSEEIQQEWDAFLSGNLQLRKTTAAVAPLIQTKWDQGGPYNNMCPKDGSNRSVTGCVATAMAQIMKYYNHPLRGIGQSKAYITDKKKINVPSVNLEVNYDWNNMLNKYTRTCEWWQYLTFCLVQTNNWNTQQADAVATLMYHAGASAEMDYTSNASGAPPYYASIALRDKFGYDNSIQLKYRNNKEYKNDNVSWEAMLKEQINAGMPVLYVGYGGSDGHAFICDGYDNSGKFHFNWGWGGSKDGYFVTSALNITYFLGIGNTNFNKDQSVIINIKPAPPTITAHPADQTVQFGQTAQFTVKAESRGANTFSFQWQVSTNGGDSFNNVANATFPTYAIPMASVAMSGNSYRCVIKNTRGVSLMSNSATLTVSPIPPTVIWPTPSAITYGDALSSSTLINGNATGVDGMNVDGTFAWNDESTIPTVVNNGYGVTFTPSDYNYIAATKNNLAITVNKANPPYTIPTDLTAAYGDFLSNIVLPEGWSWEEYETVGDAGIQTHKATFIPIDTDNYNVATGIDIAVTVAKAAPVYIAPTGLTAVYGDTISSVALPEGWSWEETGTVGNVGTRIHKATFTPTDTQNYNVATGIDIAVTVAKATSVYTVPIGLTAVYGNSISNIKLPAGWSWEEKGAVGNAGARIHKATFTPTDTINYNAVTGIAVTITVAKAAPVYTVPIGLTAVYGDFISSIILPKNWSWDIISIVGNAGPQIHKATFTPTDTGNYNIATGIDVVISVAKVAPIYVVPTGMTATYGDDLSSVILPEDWSWEETETVGNTGIQIHKATFTPIDTNNYSIATGVDLTVTVAKATPVYTVPTNITATYGDDLSSVILPAGWSWERTGSVGNAGTQVHRAAFTPTDIENYNVETGIDVTVTVVKATPKYTVPTGLTATYGDALSSVILPAGWSWEEAGTVGDAGIRIHKATFTPTDTWNYNAVTGVNVTVTVDLPVVVKSSDRTIPPATADNGTVAVAPIAPLTAEFTAGPNPASRSSGKVSFFRNGSRVSYATLSIYDASGKVVKKIRVIDDAVGSQLRRKVSSWNLRDDKGRLVAEGTYLVRGVVKTAGGKRERVEVIVGVR